ncbi:unnamed protein product [Prunus brigantina]
MVDTRRTKSNATTTGPSHGFVVETSMQPHGIVAADALQPSSSALQPPSVAGIAEQPPHDPGTSTALQSPAPITGAALPRCPAVGAQQQPHHSTTRLAAQPYGYSDVVPVLEQIHSLPPLRSHLTYAPVYASNGALVHMPLGPMHNTLLDPRSQGDLNSRINLNQGPNLGPCDEEMRAHEHAGEQFERSQAGQTGANRQGRERDCADETQTAASRTLSRSRLGSRTNVLERLGPQSDVHARLGPQGARVRERTTIDAHQPVRGPTRGDKLWRIPPKLNLLSCPTGRATKGIDPWELEKKLANHARGTEDPVALDTQGDRPLRTEEEVSQSRSTHRRRRHGTSTLRAEDVEKLVNDQLRGLRLKGSTEEALCKEIDRVDCSPFTEEVERAPPPKRFTTPSITPFKGDSDPESHLRHFKSAMILYKADDALMCKVFAMTLRGAAQDWFHTLPSASIGNFKEFAIIFTKEYTSYKTVRKHADHLFNLRKKPDESLRDYLRRFKAEKANIIGCNDQVASSAFKKGLPTEHELYRELAITPSQTLAEVFATAEHYALWDDDRIAAKKASKQVDHPTKQASQKSNKFEQKARDKRRSRPQEGSSETGTFTEFAIPIHQILAQVKDKPWVRRPLPMKGDPSKRDTSKYCAFHGEHGHYTNNCNAWKRHLEELVREGHCTEFVAKKAIQQIEDRDAAAKEPPQKVIRINTILADSQESGLTTKERKRKIAQATYVSQVTTGVPAIVDTPIIGFQKKDLIGLDLPHNDALVICIQIEQAVIERVHVDEGSAANILQLSVIQQMGFEPKISKLARSLTGFNGATSITVGTIDLDVHSPPVVCSQTFMVIDEVSPYNGILGRPWISKIEAITSALHQKIRYPIPGGGIGQINSDQAMARRCTAQGLKKSKQLQFTPNPNKKDRDEGIRLEGSLEEGWKPEDDVELVPPDPDQPNKEAQIGSRQNPNKKDRDEGIRPEGSLEEGWKPEDDVELIPPDPDQPNKEAQIGSRQNPNKNDRDEGIRPEGSLEEGWKPEEDVELVPLDPDQPDKKARIGSRLSPDEKMELTIFLQNNKDMFAWSPSDMPGIDPNIICHRLHVNPASKPVVRKRRNFAPRAGRDH